MSERSVWSSTLEDILQVMPLRAIQHAMPSMSSQELRQKAVRLARIADVFNGDYIEPKYTHSTSWSGGRSLLRLEVLLRVEVAPGGHSILILYQGGTIQLYRVQPTNWYPLATAARPNSDILSRFWAPEYAALLLSFTCGVHLAMVSDFYWGDLEYVSL